MEQAESELITDSTSDKGSLWYLSLTCIVAAVGGFLFGFDTAVISGAVVFLERHFALSSSQLGFAVSSCVIGSIFGVCFAGFLSDWLGRKKVLIFSAFLFFISALGSAIPRTLIEFVIARFVGGAAIGLAATISPLYIAEIAPARNRGALVTLNQLAITFGILISYIAAWIIAGLFDEAWKTAHSWRWMFGMECIPATVFMFALFLIPESPRWLAKEGHLDKTLDILTRVGGKKHAEQEVAEIKAAVDKEESSILTLFKPGLRKALFIGVVLSIFAQITGINTIIYYSPRILLQLGIGSDSSALLGMVIIGLVIFITTLVALFIVDRVGRRTLLIIAPSGMFVFLIITGFGFKFSGFPIWIVFLSILLYIVFFSIGLGTGFWMVISEIFPTRVRGRAMAICTFSLWTSNAIVCQFFPALMEWSEPWSFWLLAIMCFLMVIFVYKMLPETRQKTLEEIEKWWIPES